MYDFGGLLLGGKKTFAFSIVNDSKLDMSWEIVHLPQSPSVSGRSLAPPSRLASPNSQPDQQYDWPSVFTFSKKNGIIDGREEGHATTIVVTFKPEHPVKYCSRFQVVSNVSKPVHLDLLGTGLSHRPIG